MTDQAAKKVIILGATSAIAEATARLYAGEGARLALVARNASRLDAIARDLSARGAVAVDVETADFTISDPRRILAGLVSRLDGVDHVILAWGLMRDQAEAERNLDAAAEMINVNFTTAARWALAAAEIIEARGRGTLVALGSPAGDRGRRQNYIYGAAKAGLATLMEGVAHRFAARGPALRAVLIKPGPTDTPMTAGMDKQGPLWSTPEKVAQIVRSAADVGASVRYAPRIWSLIMTIIRCLPRFVFDRTNF